MDLLKFKIHELNLEETKKICGGSEFSEEVFRAAGYLSHKIQDAWNSVDWSTVLPYMRYS